MRYLLLTFILASCCNEKESDELKKLKAGLKRADIELQYSLDSIERAKNSFYLHQK